jgi:hypothetical protein
MKKIAIAIIALASLGVVSLIILKYTTQESKCITICNVEE